MSPRLSRIGTCRLIAVFAVFLSPAILNAGADQSGEMDRVVFRVERFTISLPLVSSSPWRVCFLDTELVRDEGVKIVRSQGYVQPPEQQIFRFTAGPYLATTQIRFCSGEGATADSKVFTITIRRDRELPAWMQPRIELNQLGVSSETVFTAAAIGWIRDIAFDSRRKKVVVAGSRAAVTLGSDSDFVWLVPPGGEQGRWNNTEHIKIIDADSDGVLDYLARGSSTLRLLDSRGAVTWSLHLPFTDVDAADVDGDGSIEIVGIYHSRGAELYNAFGKLLWRQEDLSGPKFEVRFADVDGKAPHEIACRTGGRLTVLDTSGRVIRAGFAPLKNSYFSEYVPANLPGIDTPHFITWNPGTADTTKGWAVFDYEGRPLLQFGNSLEYLSDPQVVVWPVGEDTFVAISGRVIYKGMNSVGFEAVHSALEIFDARLKLRYREIIAEPVARLFVDRSTSPASLLVGGNGIVRRYRLAPPL